MKVGTYHLQRCSRSWEPSDRWEPSWWNLRSRSFPILPLQDSPWPIPDVYCSLPWQCLQSATHLCQWNQVRGPWFAFLLRLKDLQLRFCYDENCEKCDEDRWVLCIMKDATEVYYMKWYGPICIESTNISTGINATYIRMCPFRNNRQRRSWSCCRRREKDLQIRTRHPCQLPCKPDPSRFRRQPKQGLQSHL